MSGQFFELNQSVENPVRNIEAMQSAENLQSIDLNEPLIAEPEAVSEPTKPRFQSVSITFVKEGKEAIAADGANLRIKAIETGVDI